MLEKKRIKKKRVTNWEKVTENTKTLFGTKVWHKNPQKQLFLYCENAPPRGGQTNNIPGGQTNNSLKAKTWPN